MILTFSMLPPLFPKRIFYKACLRRKRSQKSNIFENPVWTVCSHLRCTSCKTHPLTRLNRPNKSSDRLLLMDEVEKTYSDLFPVRPTSYLFRIRFFASQFSTNRNRLCRKANKQCFKLLLTSFECENFASIIKNYFICIH